MLPNLDTRIPPRGMPESLLAALDRLAVVSKRPLRLASEILSGKRGAPAPEPVRWWMKDGR